MLPTERRAGRIRRTLQYFGLVEPDDEGPSVREERRTGGRGHAVRVYFGLAEDPSRSRYGDQVSARLDADLDALRARVAELEERVRELEA